MTAQRLAVLALALVAVPLAAQDHLLDREGNPITVVAVSNGMHGLDHRFEYAPLSDGTPRWLSANDSSAVELTGEHYVQEISVMAGSEGSMTMIMALAFGAPWAIEWIPDAVGDTLARAQRAKSGEAETRVSRGGIEVEVAVLLELGLIHLRVHRP